MPDQASVRRYGFERVRRRDQRRYLHTLVRYTIIISGGAAVAGLTFYGLKYLGY